MIYYIYHIGEVMQTIELVILTGIGMALFAAASVMIYRVLPAIVLECNEHYGRFAGLAAAGNIQ